MIETIIDVNNFNPILVLFKHRIHSTFRAVSINFNPILVLFKPSQYSSFAYQISIFQSYISLIQANTYYQRFSKKQY